MVLHAGTALHSTATNSPPPVIIAEVMSSASYYDGTNQVAQGSDFFKVCNLGTNFIDLTHWTFTDNKGQIPVPLVSSGQDPLILAPGQCAVIYVNKLYYTTNDAQFRNWWPCLPDETQVPLRSWDNSEYHIAFSSSGDNIALYDEQTNLVDYVAFGFASSGFTFIADTNGQFGAYNWPGRPCTCKAHGADDYASFCSESPIPLRIISQPSDQRACPGMSLTFAVPAAGLPRAHYTWYFNGNVIQRGMSPTFTIDNVWPTNAGLYSVILNNGLQTTNVHWVLSIATNPSPPTIINPPADWWAFTNQTAYFTVEYCAFPIPTFQWFSNNIPILGSTQSSLTLPDCQLSMSGILYCVQICNPLGCTSVCARLTVTRKPDLRLTELHPYPNPAFPGHKNWVEIGNFDPEMTVNLRNWRIFDQPFFTNAFVITQDVILRPFECAIFVGNMSPDEFRTNWWGINNLPLRLQICPFYGFSFNPGSEVTGGGDGFYLWNQAAMGDFDTVISRCYDTCTMGVSLQFTTNQTTSTACWFGCNSQLGDPGVFTAAIGGDIGSPGYITNSPPRLVSIIPDASGTTIKWWASVGKTYYLYAFDTLGHGGTSFVQNIWCCQNLGHCTTNVVLATNWVHTFRIASPATNHTRFIFLQ